jgi:hypothetical protein
MIVGPAPMLSDEVFAAEDGSAKVFATRASAVTMPVRSMFSESDGVV